MCSVELLADCMIIHLRTLDGIQAFLNVFNVHILHFIYYLSLTLTCVYMLVFSEL